MAETVLDTPVIPDLSPSSEAASLAVVEPPATPASRLQEYIRSGKFSPEVAAQLSKVLNSDNAEAMALAATAPKNELYVLEMVGNMATGCVIAILIVGAVGLGVAVFGIIENYLMVVAGLIFVFTMLAVVAVASLNQAPAKPRPPKPAKAPKSKAAKGKAADAETLAPETSVALTHS